MRARLSHLSAIWADLAVRRKTAFLGTGVLASTIASLSLSPSEPDASPAIRDKLAHAIAFAALALPCAILYARTLKWALPLAALFGDAIKLIQRLVGRDAEFMDFVADSLGLAIGTLLGLSIRNAVRKRP